MILGALEAGGTKMVCAVGNEKGEIFDQVSIPTTDPGETIPKILAYFADKDPEALGVASFGPIDPDPESETYGYILSTPKISWQNYDLLGNLKKSLGIPMGFDTDVNGSLLGEVTYGSAKGLSDAVYITIGTGIGGGVMSGGKLLHGMLHSELGHIRLTPRPDDTYRGKCPFHGTCFEGLAAGPAIEERWGRKAFELADRDEVWELEAYYIAQALSDLILILSPKKIILGGGVMHQEQLFPLIRKKVKEELNGYLDTALLRDMDHYIVPSALNDNQGILGCLKLAFDARTTLPLPNRSLISSSAESSFSSFS
ncbi:MAG: ROK family protein [Lachnospiraceae bacterium]|nr:ROK family protein [Lachnospiraceae bacterium]